MKCPKCNVTFQYAELSCHYCGQPLESLCPSATTPCCASLADIRAAKKQRLNEGLSSLARWCDARALGDHDTDTTLTMLEKKAAALRGKVISAGWKPTLHNAKAEGPAA